MSSEATSVPLLLPLTDSESPTYSNNPKPVEKSSLDQIIERCVGHFGWAQLVQAFLVSFAWVFDAQQTFISVFTDALPPWHCSPDPTYTRSSCNSKDDADICRLPAGSWTWDSSAHVSIISEWALQCAGSIVTGLPASAFFMGCLAGGLVLATLADSSLGRKNMLVFSCLLMSVTGLFTLVSSNVWIYAALRFLCGFGRATIGTSALVLSTELVGKRWRGQVGIFGFFCFTLGFLSLPAIAYLNRGSSWRLIYLWTCIPAILYSVLVHFFVRESPRWLYVRGRKEEFVQTIRSIAAPTATLQRSSLTLSFFRASIDWEEEQTTAGGGDLYSAMKILLRKRWAIRRLAAVMLIGFGVGMVYYGMPLGVGNLAFNLYLSVTLNALAELPSSLATFLLVEKWNRKSSLLGFALLSGACSLLACASISMGNNWNHVKWLQIGLELFSFFGACTAFNVLLIFTLELFPTCVRNSALSMVRQALVLGGVFSPVLVAAGRKNPWTSFGVFGITIASCGSFVGSLPETRGGTLRDTMEEEEKEEEERAFVCNNDDGASNDVV